MRTSTGHHLGGAHPADHLVLDHVEQLGLDIQRDLADLVQKNGAPVGLLKESGLSLGTGAGKRAAHITEHLAFKQGRRNGGAVHGDEGPLAGLRLVDRPGQEGFPRTALAGDEHVAVQLGELIGMVPGRGRGGADAEQRGKGVFIRPHAALRLPVFPLCGLDGVVSLHDRDPDILNVPELHDHALRQRAAGHRQDGGDQLKAVDLVLHILVLRHLAAHHLCQMAFKAFALKKFPKMIALDLDLEVGLFAMYAPPRSRLPTPSLRAE